MTLILLLWLATNVVLPKNTILLPGAVPSASDATTPLPEQGSVSAGRYRNAYFGLTWPIPAGWKQQPAGPPPSDGGVYVLGEFATFDANDPHRVKAHVLITAEDFFFTSMHAANAREFSAAARAGVPARYIFEGGSDQVTIAGHAFQRFAYTAPVAKLHWRILTTDVRCHALTFTFTGTDTATLDAAESALAGLTLHDTGPRCVNHYDDIVEKVTPSFEQRYNTIPVRIVIDAHGRVKHIHLLTAFPEQSSAIIAALRQWRFKPYRIDGKSVPVETGIIFGIPRTAVAGR